MNKKLLQISISIATITLLAGCEGNIKESLGLKKKAPDEFLVFSHPNLDVPPNFYLTPPTTKAIEGNRNKIRDEARNILISNKENNISSKKATKGESNFLSKVGKADPSIRELLKEDSDVAAIENEEGFFEKILAPIKNKESEPIIDADAEKKRLDKELN